ASTRVKGHVRTKADRTARADLHAAAAEPTCCPRVPRATALAGLEDLADAVAGTRGPAGGRDIVAAAALAARRAVTGATAAARAADRGGATRAACRDGRSARAAYRVQVRRRADHGRAGGIEILIDEQDERVRARDREGNAIAKRNALYVRD